MSTLRARILRASAALNLTIETLGLVDDEPIWLITPPNPSGKLVAAGFHGDEPAGPWGVLSYLEHAAITNTPVTTSFLPIVNPTGLINNTRVNKYGEDPNRGFCHSLDSTSKEGNILLAHVTRLLDLAKNGFVSLHEDSGSSSFYLYSFEDSVKPGDFSTGLRDSISGILNIDKSEIVADSDASEGIIFRECDGSFEDFMFHRGVPRTACTETPGLLDLDIRVTANRVLISSFD